MPGMEFIECIECGTASNDADWMANHMTVKHSGRPDPLRAELEEQMAAFRKQVEREFATTVASLFWLVVEAKENSLDDFAADGNVEGHRAARITAFSYREAIQSVRVMADLDPDTGEPA